MTGTMAARISAQPFFAALTDTQRAALAEDGITEAFTAGERVFGEGGIADRFWLIEYGSIALDLRVPGRGDRVIETLGPGTMLGWSWLHPPYRWHFGAVARLATTAIAFDAASVRRRCDADPAFGYALLRLFTPLITERLQATRLRLLDLYAAPSQVGQARYRAGRRVTSQGAAMSALAEPAAAVPRFYRVASRREDTGDTVTMELTEPAIGVPAFAPGQFAMLTALGVGEVPISVSGLGDNSGGQARRLQHTLRAVGAVTRALHAAQPGSLIGVRGPFGTGWDVASAAGRDVVIVAGGIGLAPLRPVVLTALADRSRYGRIVLLVGARTPGDLLYTDELERWRRDGVEVAVTVDRADSGWDGEVGLVTALIKPAGLAPGNSVAFVCGPDIMMRFTADALAAEGIPVHRIRVSLERNMRCGAAWCGHCQLGPLLVCRDGPVVGYDRAAALMSVREL